jgi:hypothetical protein
MDRQELVALRDVLDLILRLPASLHPQVAAWLMPEAAKPGNGLDHHPPPVAQTAEAPKRNISSPSRSPTPHASKARPGAPPTSAKTAEQRLLAAMREHSGATVIALAKAIGANRSSTGEKLRELSKRGLIEKDAAGRWRLAGDDARPPPPGPEPRPPQPPAG